MNEQLNFSGETVPTCTGCGGVLPTRYSHYSGDKCDACRLNIEGEDMLDCDGCQQQYLEGDLYVEAYFFSPWDEEETETGFKFCQSCIDQGADQEQHFYCDGCSRDISDSNGRMYYYRILNDCEQVCLRCIQEDLESGGIAALNDEDVLNSVIKDGKPWGMFFNVGELEAKGWEAVPGWDDTRFDEERAPELARTCRELYEADKPFIIGYERLSIVGDEGYITVYTRPDNGTDGQDRESYSDDQDRKSYS